MSCSVLFSVALLFRVVQPSLVDWIREDEDWGWGLGLKVELWNYGLGLRVGFLW